MLFPSFSAGLAAVLAFGAIASSAAPAAPVISIGVNAVVNTDQIKTAVNKLNTDVVRPRYSFASLSSRISPD